jgi:MFS family permease
VTDAARGPLDRPAGYLELLIQNRPFRRLFLARITSLLGDWFNTLAVLALLRQIGGSDALAFGWVLILKTLPSVAMTPFAGVLVDRFSRRWLMVGMDVLRAGIVLALIGLEAAPEEIPAVGILYGLVFLMTAARAVADPARNAVVPDLVAPKDLVTANALGAASWSLMFTVGTALGGIVTAELGWKLALIIDIGTYLVSAAIVVGLAIPESHRDQPQEGQSFLDGLRYLAARPRVWTLAAIKSGWALSGGITLVLTILGERVYAKTLAPYADGPEGAAMLGVTVLYLARGVGTGLGPIISRQLARNDPVKSERLIGVALLWGAVCYLTFGQVDRLPLAMLCLILAHIGGATVWVFSTVRLQASVPTWVRGRVFAVEQGGFTFTMAASTYVFSNLIDADALPLSTIASALGAVMLVPSALWWLRGWLLGWGPDPDPQEQP